LMVLPIFSSSSRITRPRKSAWSGRPVKGDFARKMVCSRLLPVVRALVWGIGLTRSVGWVQSFSWKSLEINGDLGEYYEKVR
jgi:hypothetical protein